MARMMIFVALVSYFHLAEFTDPACVIELECAECVPDNMPAVTSHRAAAGALRVPVGDEVTLACPGGAFLRYPLRATLSAVCEAGRYRVRHDYALRHLLELGCQENIFEDVLHQVEHCGAPLQGRAYQTQEPGGGGAGTRHLATVCFDADRGVAVRAHATSAPHNALRLAPHAEARAPLSLLGNFNHMFDARTRADAERLYSDDVRLNRRLHEIFKHERFNFAGQTLTAATLLSPHYLEDQNMRVTDFVSNKVAAWSSVAEGNLHHLHRDVSRLMRLSRGALHVYAGTHGVLSLRTAHTRADVFLKPDRFPVPRYIWTVVHDEQNQKALAITVLNEPFVSVSDVRESVFCESACGGAGWLHELRRHRHYESPVYGLTFCCSVHNFTDVVPEMPKDILKNVPVGNAGMLMDFVP